MTDRRLFVLLAHDPETGCATAVAGVLGLDDGVHHLSWIPYQAGVEGWRQRIVATTADMADALEAWAQLADGITWDLLELETAGSPDLQGDGEADLDELLVAAGADER